MVAATRPLAGSTDPGFGRSAMSQREAAVRRRGLEQQHVVEAQHGRIGGVAIGQPDRAGIETGQRPPARLHVGKSAQPDETVGIVEIAELADDRPSPPTPGLRRDGCRKCRSACRACPAPGRIAEARRPATGAPTVSCEAWSSSALPRAACHGLESPRAVGRGEMRRAPDTLLSGAARRRRPDADIHPFHRPRHAPYSRHGQIPSKNHPRSRRTSSEPSAAQPADRIPRRRGAAAAQGLLRSAAGRIHRRAAHGIGRRLGRADRPRPRRRAPHRQAKPQSPKKIPERSSAPTKTARGTSMGGAASARERAAAGLNPVAGLDIALEDAELDGQFGRHRDRRGAVGADRERQSAAQERPAVDAAPPGPAGKVRRRHRDHHESRFRAGRRPADGDQGSGRGRRPRRPHPGAARRHRLRQDLHHGQGDRGDAAPGADPGAQQDAGRAALQRVQEILPGQRGRVFRLLLRLLPAGGLRPAHRHLYREGIVDQRADRPHAPLGDALAARARRRHHRRLGLLHLRYRLGRDLHGDDLPDAGRRPARPARAARRPRRPAIQAPGHQFRARLVPRARRHDRDLPGPPRGLAPGASRCSATRSRPSPSSIR